MNKLWIALVAATLSFTSLAQESGNYLLIIENDTLQIDLDEETTYNLSRKQKLKIKLIQPELLTYSDDMVSFKHKSGMSVTNSQVDVGISQCMLMSPTGNGFMIQKYETINPTSLSQFLMHELTKESIGYGYKSEQKPFKKTLASGEVIEGVQNTLTYQGEEEIYTVASYGRKDRGILVVTMMLSPEFTADSDMIEEFLNTLVIKL